MNFSSVGNDRKLNDLYSLDIILKIKSKMNDVVQT